VSHWRTAIALALGAGLVLTAIASASAAVVCNVYDECWQTRQTYAVTLYPPALGVHIYGDDWRDQHRDDRRYHWRADRSDRGYYSHGEWHAFEK